ncbi:MAG: hypothetical protein OXE92_10960 [Bacteroidetes bacterium]|nr:hypothetical protein [Bacteroidota bacterium]
MKAKKCKNRIDLVVLFAYDVYQARGLAVAHVVVSPMDSNEALLAHRVVAAEQQRNWKNIE